MSRELCSSVVWAAGGGGPRLRGMDKELRGERCGQCGAGELEPGFVEDAGEGSRGFARWVAGPLERGIFGGAKRFGRERWEIEAFRCVGCGHLELYARHRA